MKINAHEKTNKETIYCMGFEFSLYKQTKLISVLKCKDIKCIDKYKDLALLNNDLHYYTELVICIGYMAEFLLTINTCNKDNIMKNIY